MKQINGGLVLAMLIAGLAMGACGGDDTASPPGSESEDELKPDDLLAVLDPADVAATFIQPETWWPLLPEFNVGFEPASEPIEGDRFYVTQSYQQVGALASGRIETTLILFDGNAEATAGFASMAAFDGEDSAIVEGPAAGDESRYFTHEATDEELEEGALPYKTTLRLRVGTLVGRLSVFTELGFEQAETLAAYFAPIGRRAEALLAGDLRAPALPEAIGALLPSAPEPPVGPVLGSALRPAESWAVVDTSGDPEAALARLHELGVTELGLRRYGLQGAPDLVVETTVYEMTDGAAAEEWVATFVEDATDAGPLDAGATGNVSAYTSYGGEFYELQFAAGPIVGDVVCFAPFGAASAACEAPVRALAEQWYQQLGAP